MHGKQENRFSMLNGLRRLRREDRFFNFEGKCTSRRHENYFTYHESGELSYLITSDVNNDSDNTSYPLPSVSAPNAHSESFSNYILKGNAI